MKTLKAAGTAVLLTLLGTGLWSGSGCALEEAPNGPKGPDTSLVDGYRRDGSLPMLLSANGFDPSGYMGDGGSSPGSLKMDTGACLMPRGPGAAGACYKVTYAPGPAGWAGIYWQYPKNNWGGAQGRPIEPGARKLTFYAAGGGADSIELEVTAGGINPYLSDGEFQDTFRAQRVFKVGPGWALHTLDFDTTSAYTQVIGGFCWSMSGTQGAEPIVFWIDGIKWEK